MSRPRLSQLRIWKNHENRVLEVLIEALSILQAKTNLGQSEIQLNRDLYFCLLRANRTLYLRGKGFDHPPVSEAHNPPDPDDVQRAIRENKISDFLWGFIDHNEPDPERSARNYVIECKRLGKSQRSDWILNENYVRHGIIRFIVEEYGYAKGENSGAMVGYVQSMEFDDILTEINATAIESSIPKLLEPGAGWRVNGTSQIDHKLERSFQQSPFYLHHFWVDLHKCYDTNSW